MKPDAEFTGCFDLAHIFDPVTGLGRGSRHPKIRRTRSPGSSESLGRETRSLPAVTRDHLTGVPRPIDCSLDGDLTGDAAGAGGELVIEMK